MQKDERLFEGEAPLRNPLAAPYPFARKIEHVKRVYFQLTLHQSNGSEASTKNGSHLIANTL